MGAKQWERKGLIHRHQGVQLTTGETLTMVLIQIRHHLVMYVPRRHQHHQGKMVNKNKNNKEL